MKNLLYFTKSEAAKILGVSRQAIYDRIDAGTIEWSKKQRNGRRNTEDLIALGQLTKHDAMLDQDYTPRILDLFTVT